MNIRHLRFFVELAKTEHMAKTAEKLGISQPSLSYAISSIEEELGVPLFEKEGRNIRLTNYGKIYLEYVKSGLSDLDRGGEYIAELLDVNRGHIRVGFTFTMGQDLIPQLICNIQLALPALPDEFKDDLISRPCKESRLTQQVLKGSKCQWIIIPGLRSPSHP